jgi:anaerobic selenocysteine-containing dehydrogenase
MPNFGDLILEGKPYRVRMMFIIASNPVITWPNTPRVRQALEKLEFLVSMDLFMTETAQYADIVLPACTFVEKYSMPDVTQAAMLRRPIIPTYEESWSDCKFWRELAQRMGYEKEFPWKSDEETLDYYLEPSGTTVRQLRDESPNGMFPVTKAYYEYKKKGFKTSSGKFEFYCEELKTLGYDPMPIYREPKVGPVTTPDLVAKYPVNLITGVREPGFWHSQYRNLPKLRNKFPEPLADIHPDTAKKYGISDGDMMIVENWIGSIEIKAKVTEDIMPNVVNVPHAWPQASGNMLTDDKPVDPEVGYPSFTALLCRIRKKA